MKNPKPTTREEFYGWINRTFTRQQTTKAETRNNSEFHCRLEISMKEDPNDNFMKDFPVGYKKWEELEDDPVALCEQAKLIVEKDPGFAAFIIAYPGLLHYGFESLEDMALSIYEEGEEPDHRPGNINAISWNAEKIFASVRALMANWYKWPHDWLTPKVYNREEDPVKVRLGKDEKKRFGQIGGFRPSEAILKLVETNKERKRKRTYNKKLADSEEVACEELTSDDAVTDEVEEKPELGSELSGSDDIEVTPTDDCNSFLTLLEEKENFFRNMEEYAKSVRADLEFIRETWEEGHV